LVTIVFYKFTIIYFYWIYLYSNRTR